MEAYWSVRSTRGSLRGLLAALEASKDGGEAANATKRPTRSD
jgi:hypothetical protein